MPYLLLYVFKEPQRFDSRQKYMKMSHISDTVRSIGCLASRRANNNDVKQNSAMWIRGETYFRIQI
jgi:hypothetical protein